MLIADALITGLGWIASILAMTYFYAVPHKRFARVSQHENLRCALSLVFVIAMTLTSGRLGILCWRICN